MLIQISAKSDSEFDSKASKKQISKAKTNFAVGKAVKEFSWSSIDDTDQNLMLTQNQITRKQLKKLRRDAPRRKNSHKKRTTSSKKDYVKLLKKIKTIERSIDQVNKALITGLTNNNERVSKVEIKQQILDSQIFDLTNTYGMIDSKISSFGETSYDDYQDDDYRSYDGKFDIGDIVPADNGVEVDSNEQDHFYSIF